jgi:hypothetical protein
MSVIRSIQSKTVAVTTEEIRRARSHFTYPMDFSMRWYQHPISCGFVSKSTLVAISPRMIEIPASTATASSKVKPLTTACSSTVQEMPAPAAGSIDDSLWKRRPNSLRSGRWNPPPAWTMSLYGRFSPMKAAAAKPFIGAGAQGGRKRRPRAER